MSDLKITNEMLYELLKEFNNDVDRRFSEHDKRFEQVDKQFEQVFTFMREERAENHRQFGEVRALIKEDKQKLQEVYDVRDQVKVSFGWQWSAISFSIAIIASFLGGGLALAFVR